MLTNRTRRIAAVISCIIICGSLFAGCAGKTITGNEWLLVQEQCLDDLQAYTSSMDDVYTLFLTSAITNEDFLNEVRLLKTQYGTLNQFYEKLKAEHPVKEGSHSYVSKRGTEGIEKSYEVIGKILDNTLDGQGRPKSAQELSYTYLAYKQELTAALSEFVTSVVWLQENENS